MSSVARGMGRPTASLPQTPQAFPGTHPGQQSPHSPPCLHFLSPLLIFLVSTELSKQIGASPRWTKRFGGLGHKAELRGFSPGAGIAGRGLGRPARFQLAGLGKGCGRDRRGRGLSFTPEATVTPAAGNGEVRTFLWPGRGLRCCLCPGPTRGCWCSVKLFMSMGGLPDPADVPGPLPEALSSTVPTVLLI